MPSFRGEGHEHLHPGIIRSWLVCNVYRYIYGLCRTSLRDRPSSCDLCSFLLFTALSAIGFKNGQRRDTKFYRNYVCLFAWVGNAASLFNSNQEGNFTMTVCFRAARHFHSSARLFSPWICLQWLCQDSWFNSEMLLLTVRRVVKTHDTKHGNTFLFSVVFWG